MHSCCAAALALKRNFSVPSVFFVAVVRDQREMPL
jgi:hypothetical protein